LCSPCVTPARWMHGHIPADPPSTSCGVCRSAAGFFQPDSRQSACLATVQFEGCYQDASNATECKLCEANTRTYKGTGDGTNRSECMCAFPVFFQCGHRFAQGRLLLKPSALYLYAVMLAFCGCVCASGAKRSTTFRGGKRRYAKPPLCAATWAGGPAASLALQGDPCKECPEGGDCPGKGAPPCVSSMSLPLPTLAPPRSPQYADVLQSRAERVLGREWEQLVSPMPVGRLPRRR
jgi:hypothetical protein